VTEYIYGGWKINVDGSFTEGDRDFPTEEEQKAIPILSTPIRAELMLRADLLELLSGNDLLYSRAYKAAHNVITEDKGGNCYLFFSDSGDALIILRADCIGKVVSIQSLLIERMNVKPLLGDFAFSFPDVNELAKDLGSLSIRDLSRVFLAEKNRTAEKIELLGAKLDVQTVSTWGILILLTVAGYLYVIFREFVKRVSGNDEAWGVPWIGSSSEMTSGMAFYFTIAIFLLTVGFLTWRGAYLLGTVAGALLYGLAMLFALTTAAGIIWCRHNALAVRKVPMLFPESA